MYSRDLERIKKLAFEEGLPAITYTHNTECLQGTSESAGHSDAKIIKRTYVQGAIKRRPTK